MDRDAYNRLGEQLNQVHSAQLTTQLAVFQLALVNFASEHAAEIEAKPEFRVNFTKICHQVGIDPVELVLYSKPKDNANFHTGLAVKVVDVCQDTRNMNGGLVSFTELIKRLQDNSVNLDFNITETDVLKSLDILGNLGSGYEVLTINSRRWLKFSMTSASDDSRRIYELCSFMGGFVTYRLLRDNYGWDRLRCKSVLDEMLMNGFLWVDAQGPETQYWEPAW